MSSKSDRIEDIGPDDSMDLENGVKLEPNPDVEIALEVPFDAEDLRGLSEMARERGTTPIEAARQIVHEAVAGRSR